MVLRQDIKESNCQPAEIFCSHTFGVFSCSHRKFSWSSRPYLLQQNIVTTGITVSQAQSTLRRKILKTQQSVLLLDFCFRKTGTGAFEKLRSQTVFSFSLKRKVGVFKFLCFEERFQNAPFSWRIRVDGRSNHSNKAVFSNFSGVLWTVSQSLFLWP